MNPSDQARQVGVVDSWLAQYLAHVVYDNPPAVTNLADTGALVAGYYDVLVNFSATAALALDNLYFMWRNAANNGNIWYAVLVSPGAVFQTFHLRNVKVAANERFRFTVGVDFTGSMDTGIIAIRRA